MDFVAALSIGTARRIGEIGFIIGAVGGLLLLFGAARGGGRAETYRVVMALAGLCIAVGFALGIVELHWGPIT